MMDTATLTFVYCILLPSTALGKPFVTDIASFTLKAPDNDTGTWMWKTANSKVSFRHFHNTGDNPGNGYWTLEVKHSETVPKKSQTVREMPPATQSTNSMRQAPSVILVTTPNRADVLQEEMRALRNELPTEEQIPSIVILEDFHRKADADDKPEDTMLLSLREPFQETFTKSNEEKEDLEVEENWWLPGEDLEDEEEDGYFHVRNVMRVKLYGIQKKWQDARQKCHIDGGYLAVPDTGKKAQVIQKLLHSRPEIPGSSVLRNQVYIGIHDPLHRREWITVMGNAFMENIWAPGEPDNEPPGEDCVTFRTDGKIRDVPCFYSLPFVCEKPLPPSEEID